MPASDTPCDGEILFLSHRMPWPPNRGDKIRSHHILKYLARLAPVHAATFAEDAEDRAQEKYLSAIAATHCLVARNKPLLLAGMEAVLKGQPVSIAAFRHNAIESYIRPLLTAGRIGAIVVFSGQMAQYVPDDFAGTVIMDFVDVDSAKFESYAATSHGPMRWVLAREGRHLSAYEAAMARRADVSLFVSEAEAALFRKRSGLGEDKVRSLANGIDTVFYDPAHVFPNPALADRPGPALVFTGQMDYPPNIDAVIFFSRQVMPRILETHKDAVFAVVGRNPSDRVTALDGKNATMVMGSVDDVRGWIQAADIVVAPLRIARGVQNKVLEAMAMARPVMASPEAAEGIIAQPDVHLQVADGAAAQAQTICAMLDDSQSACIMGIAAREHVVATMGWDAALAPLKDMLAAKTRAQAEAAC